MGVAFKKGGMISYVTVSVSAQTGGTASGGGRFMKGQSVIVTATANGGYKFDGWYDGDTKVSESNPYSFTPATDITLTARYVLYSVTVSGGTAARNADGSWTLHATIPTDYDWNGWYNGGTLVSTANPYTFTPTSDIMLTAKTTARPYAGLTWYTYMDSYTFWKHPTALSLNDVSMTLFARIGGQIKSVTFPGKNNNGVVHEFVFSEGGVRIRFQWRDSYASASVTNKPTGTTPEFALKFNN